MNKLVKDSLEEYRKFESHEYDHLYDHLLDSTVKIFGEEYVDDCLEKTTGPPALRIKGTDFILKWISFKDEFLLCHKDYEIKDSEHYHKFSTSSIQSKKDLGMVLESIEGRW